MVDSFILSQVRHLPLFTYLSPEQAEIVAGAFQQKRYGPGDRLYRQGDSAQAMYVFASGGGVVLVTGSDGAERQQGNVGPGMFVGEDSLFVPGRRESSVAITQDSTVLVLTKARFDALLQARPDIRQVLNIPKDLLNAVQTQQQRGVRPDETTLLITRRHPWAVAGKALRGAVLFAVLVGLALASTQLPGDFARILPIVLLGLAVLLPGFMMIYYFLEWRNDYFVVTNQRVIHEERSLLTGEERREQALLTRVQNVNVSRRGAIAEMIGFGDVVVDTAGAPQPLVLDKIPDPMKVQKAIFQQIQRRRESEAAGNQDAIRAQVEAVLTGAPNNATTATVPPPLYVQPRSPGALTRLIWAVFPPMRLVEGDRITYHKHWIVLLGKVWKPLLFFGLLVALILVRWSRRLALLSDIPGLIFWGGAALWLALSALWWWWEYVDWRGDIYILDDQSIIDIKRRPLWLRETREQAALQQIQNVTSEVRSFWGQIFHIGTVIIQTAAEHGTMVFSAVHNPTGIAEEILQRVQRRTDTESNAGQDEQRRLVAQYLSAYHQATQNDSALPNVPTAPPSTTPPPAAPPVPPASQTQPIRPPIWRGSSSTRSQPPSARPPDRTMPGQLPEMPPDLDQTQPRKADSDTQRIEPPKPGT